MEKHLTNISKFLSYILRHNPGDIGLELDRQGWVGIDDLLTAARKHGRAITRGELEDVVEQNEKKRFALSDDGLRIRASQGHSMEIELGYESSQPPEVLYHGTATRNLDSIRMGGLLKGNRHHVHLSSDEETALAVGRRHGRAVVLRVRAGEMAGAGFAFYVSANGVWLTETVPPSYIDEA